MRLSVRRPAAAASLVVALTVVAAACSGTQHIAGVDSLSGPASTTSTTSAAAPATNSVPCTEPKASLRPQGPPVVIPGSFMDQIRQRGRLIAGVDQNTYLFGYLDPTDGQLRGFDIDMVVEIAKAIFGDPTPDAVRANNHIQLKAITSAQRIPFLRDNSVDIVVRTMTATCPRWQQVDFSSIYYLAGQKVLVPKGSGITGSKDLGGKTVCGTVGSTSLDNVRDVKLTGATAPAIPYPVADWSDCLVALQQDKADAVSTDDSILLGLTAQDPTNTQIVGSSFSDQPYGMAINQAHPDFVRFVNGVLEQIRTNGRWAQIYAAHLPGAVPAPPGALYKD